MEGGLPQPPLGQSRQDTTSHRSPIPNAHNHIPAFFPRQPCNSGVMPGNEGGNAFEYRKVKQHATHSGETGSGSIPFPIAFSSSIRIPIAIWILGNSRGHGACGGIPLFQYRCHAAAFVKAPDAVCVPIECFMYDSTLFGAFLAFFSPIIYYPCVYCSFHRRCCALFSIGGVFGRIPFGWMAVPSLDCARGALSPIFRLDVEGAGSGGRNDAETSAHNGCRGACSRRVTRTPETASWFDAAAGRRVRPGAPHKSRYKGRHSAYMVGPVGFEPTTNGL